MSNELTHNPGQFDEVIHIIDSARSCAMKAVNAELIQMYWSVGEYLSELCTNAEFGDKIIDDVAAYIAKENPGVKGFNRRICDTTGDTNQLDEPFAYHVQLQDGGGATFLHGALCKGALFKTRVRTPDQ